MKRLVVGVTGDSRVIYGIFTLESLWKSDIERHPILSPAARTSVAEETAWKRSVGVGVATGED